MQNRKLVPPLAILKQSQSKCCLHDKILTFVYDMKIMNKIY